MAIFTLTHAFNHGDDTSVSVAAVDPKTNAVCAMRAFSPLISASALVAMTIISRYSTTPASDMDCHATERDRRSVQSPLRSTAIAKRGASSAIATPRIAMRSAA